MHKKNCAILLLILLLLAAWGFWRVSPYLSFIPKRVRLSSAVYLRWPYSGLQDTPSVAPAQPLLAPEWTRLTIDREKSLAIFETSTGEKVQVALGKPHWVKGCENHFRMQAFPLASGLSLGERTFQQPVLIVACKGYPAGVKFRPAKVILKEGPISEKETGFDDPFYMGVRCEAGEALCLSFSEGLGELVGTVSDAVTGAELPEAQITLSSGTRSQEFRGSFRLPVYVDLQVDYQISLPGYLDRIGKMTQFAGNQLDIMWFTTADRSRGQGDTLILPGYGQQVDYTFELSK